MHTSYLRASLALALVGTTLFGGGATLAAAQTLPEGVTQEQIDAALADLTELYGAPVVRTDQAKAICNQEQYVIACAEIGKKHGLFPKERVQQVDVLVEHLKGEVAKKIAACSDVDCLVKVANTVAKELARTDATVAEAVDLTPQKIEEKKDIVVAAKEAGVDFEQCRTMDPDTAPVELLRSCAKLAKDERVQKHIAEDVRDKADKTDASIALKDSLERGDIQCGDNTIEGCGNFCLNPTEAAREQGVAAIPSICREIATRFFGPEGIQTLEEAYTNVQGIKGAVERGDTLMPPPPVSDLQNPTGNPDHPPVNACSTINYPPCPQGEYRQESVSAIGCPFMSACIPIPTKTLPKQINGQVICPAMPSVNECPPGQEKYVTYSSPECGSYNSCRPVKEIDMAVKFPYTFGNNKVVYSWEEAKSYCYQYGEKVTGECETRFGFILPKPPINSCEQYGTGWHQADQSGNCFNPANTEYRMPGGALQLCGVTPVYGCANTTKVGECLSDQYWNGSTCVKQTIPAGQKNQVWNSHGLQSWVREDADPARIESLKQACAEVKSNAANVWTTSGGDYTSKDFGMPDPDKCRSAAQCTSDQYFNGSSCVSGGNMASTTITAVNGCWTNTSESSCNASSLGCRWDTTVGGSPCMPAGMGMMASSTITGTCSSDLIALLGNGCFNNGNAWFSGDRSKYVLPGTKTIASCVLNPMNGCTNATTSTCPTGQMWNGSMCTYDINTPEGCAKAGRTWDTANAYCKAPPPLPTGVPVTSAQYQCASAGGTWNETNKFCSMPTQSTDAMIQGCKTAGGTWDFSANYCKMPSTYYSNNPSNPYSTAYNASTTSGSATCGSYTSMATCTANSNCNWNASGNYCAYNSNTSYSGTSQTCPSGQYWDARFNGCKSMQTACTEAGGTWDTATSYCRMPNTSTYNYSYTTSSSTGSYSSASAQQGCTSAGGTWNSATNYCSMPNSGSAGSCGSGMYWNGSSCVSSGSSSGGTMDYSSMQSGCTSAGGTWMGTYCKMPSSGGASGGTSGGTMDYSSMQSGCASAGGTWMGTYCKMPGTSYFCPQGSEWMGSHCTYAAGLPSTQTASILQAIFGILGF